MRSTRTILTLALMLAAAPATAQDQPAPEPRRTRIGLGPQVVPSYPGARSVSVRPLVEFSRTRGDTPFEFEAPDESAGFPVYRRTGVAIGPAIGFEGSRTARDVGTAVPKVGASFEVGGFVQYALRPEVRVRVEARRGLGGHDAWIGVVGADYVARDSTGGLISIGPRVTLADARYQRTYFGVMPAAAAASGLPAFRPGAGVQAVGATLGYLRQFGPRWGIYSYAKYDRLVNDAARSPIVRRFGERNQLSGGLALTYVLTGRRD